jgi:hypothetical protein
MAIQEAKLIKETATHSQPVVGPGTVAAGTTPERIR